MTPGGKPFLGIFGETMLRPGWLRTQEGPVNTLAEYNKIVKPLLHSSPAQSSCNSKSLPGTVSA